MGDESILRSVEGGVALMTLNRPSRRNAFDDAMYRHLAGALDAAREDDAIRVALVTGEGTAFSAGQDLGEMGGATRAAGFATHGFGVFLDSLIAFDKPLVAAVNGVGVGVGLTMLLHCDFVLMSSEARLRAPFTTLGVVPEAASSYLLPLLVGVRAATDILFSAGWISAERALALGIATEVCAPADLLPTARAKAAELAALPLGSLRHTKRLLLATRAEQVRAANARELAAFALRVGSPENVEAVRAFLEKRSPDFAGVSPADRT
jgi:enoyl-CoA hydratase/carnithine racemase